MDFKRDWLHIMSITKDENGNIVPTQTAFDEKGAFVLNAKTLRGLVCDDTIVFELGGARVVTALGQTVPVKSVKYRFKGVSILGALRCLLGHLFVRNQAGLRDKAITNALKTILGSDFEAKDVKEFHATYKANKPSDVTWIQKVRAHTLTELKALCEHPLVFDVANMLSDENEPNADTELKEARRHFKKNGVSLAGMSDDEILADYREDMEIMAKAAKARELRKAALRDVPQNETPEDTVEEESEAV